ncbi:hypothetical protein Tco_0034267, partial [Tanacetum coccineum]
PVRRRRYEMEEGYLAQILLITGKPIHYTIPLLVARLVCLDGHIEDIHDHQRETLSFELRMQSLDWSSVSVDGFRAVRALGDLRSILERNANNQRKWETITEGTLQQLSKIIEVVRAHATGQAARKRMLGICVTTTSVKGEKESHECGFWLWWESGFIKRGYRDEGVDFDSELTLSFHAFSSS